MSLPHQRVTRSSRYESAPDRSSARGREVTPGCPVVHGHQRRGAVRRGKYVAKLFSTRETRRWGMVVVHPCKTVGVVLRWFESITRHQSKTASELRKRNSEAVAQLGERGTVSRTVDATPAELANGADQR